MAQLSSLDIPHYTTHHYWMSILQSLSSLDIPAYKPCHYQMFPTLTSLDYHHLKFQNTTPTIYDTIKSQSSLNIPYYNSNNPWKMLYVVMWYKNAFSTFLPSFTRYGSDELLLLSVKAVTVIL